MEFNITLTAEDYFGASALVRKEFGKKGSQHTISIILRILLLIAFFAPGIFVIIISILSGRYFLEAYIFALALWIILALCWAFFGGINKAYSRYVWNKFNSAETRKFKITTDTIMEETENFILETRIQGINNYLENSRLYYIYGPGGSYIFPKAQIENIAEKDEFYRWINGIKEQTEELTKEELTGHRFWFLRKGISSVLRETFIEDSPRRGEDDTTMNNETKH